MMYQLTVQEVTYQDYPVQFLPPTNSKEETLSVNEIVDFVLSTISKQKQIEKTLSYRTLSNLLETDSSSVQPHLEMKSETSKIKEISEEFIPYGIEFDIVVKMLPVKNQVVLVRVKSREKATPCIVEPEGV
jgi:hypothetical protein